MALGRFEQMPSARSLKARALQLLAQREQSQVELRRKLLQHLKAGEVCETKARLVPGASSSPEVEPMDSAGQVEAVLDWLQAHQFASDERFAESRIHARSARFGNLRIRQELKQHAVLLTPEARQRLDDSEEARAAAVYERRFGSPPETAAERAKRARFLAARGFSSDVVRRVLKQEVARGGDGGAPD